MEFRLHSISHTTPRIQAELQLSKGLHRSLSRLYDINPKTLDMKK